MFKYMPMNDVRKWLEKLMSNNDQDETAMRDTMFAFIRSSWTWRGEWWP
jgi:hypothetical protein